MAPHSSTVAWKIPWTEEPGRLQPMGLRRVGHDWATSLSTRWRRKWQPTPVFSPGESQGRRSLVGCRLWGCTESDTTEATWQQQYQQSLFSREVVSDSLRPHGLKPARLLCPWDFPGKILEWVTISFFRGSSWLRDQTHISCIGRWIHYHWVAREKSLEIMSKKTWVVFWFPAFIVKWAFPTCQR